MTHRDFASTGAPQNRGNLLNFLNPSDCKTHLENRERVGWWDDGRDVVKWIGRGVREGFAVGKGLKTDSI
jgi:hypothetical protein